ncbi:MAG: hypothetical protein LBL83_06185 [Clostridiales bacterium]|jgi:DNA-binding SARP family transcriptional activator|nr:hypothetical protein [Clostridiales bacterium]
MIDAKTGEREAVGLKIYTFGGFRLIKDGKSVLKTSGRSKKMWDLFKYIITQRDRKLSVLDCYEAVWGEDDSGLNPAASLQNLVYRLRRAIDAPDDRREGGGQPAAAGGGDGGDGSLAGTADATGATDAVGATGTAGVAAVAGAHAGAGAASGPAGSTGAASAGAAGAASAGAAGVAPAGATGNGDGGTAGNYIMYSSNSYYWNTRSDYWLDAQEFEGLAARARAARAADPGAAIGLYQGAIDLYQGEYLPEYIYNNWIIASRNKYSRIFLECGSELATLLRGERRYQEVLALCEKIFANDVMDDIFHAIFIDTLIDMGKIVQAQAHYQYITSMLYREMGIKPTQTLRQAYDRIKKHGGLKQADLSEIQERLNEEASERGAFYCDLDVFRAIYQLETRRMPRQGFSQFLCLATLIGNPGQEASQKEMKDALEALIAIAVRTLRSGDVVSKWNDDQLLLLLPSISAEDNMRVMGRIETSFCARADAGAGKIGIRLEYASLMKL